MSQMTLMVIAILVATGAISWHRSGKKTVMDLVTAQDKLTTKGCIQMALQMLGSALEPHSAKSPADAIAAGARALEVRGMSCAIVVKDGVTLPSEVQEGSVLAGLLIDALKQAGG